MLFIIQKIDNTDDAVIVTGETHCGIIKGIWKSKTIRPVTGTSYNIELTFGLSIAAIDRSDVTIEPAQMKAAVSITDGRVRFTGLCETVEDIYFIRFSFDGLEMLDIENDDHTIKEGNYLTFSLPFEEIGIYPY